MNADYFRLLFDYSYWASDRVLKALAGMSEEEYARANGFNYGSIRGILTHCLDGEYGWRCRFDGEKDEGKLDEVLLPTIDALAERWKQEELSMRAFLMGLTDSDLLKDVIVRRANGGERRHRLWQGLAHVINHSTQHRSEAAEALTLMGRSPGDLDLIVYFRERDE